MKNSFTKKVFNFFVFICTKKPEQYVHVSKPKTLQDFRQIQYNKWCKRRAVYNGSYLPECPDTLITRGWNETTSPKNTTGDHRDFQHKTTGQMVRYDKKSFKKGCWEDEHYHWENATSISERRKLKDENRYKDRYGIVCPKDSPESHLAPLDKDYKYRR